MSISKPREVADMTTVTAAKIYELQAGKGAGKGVGKGGKRKVSTQAMTEATKRPTGNASQAAAVQSHHPSPFS